MQNAKRYTKKQQKLIDGIEGEPVRSSYHLKAAWERILERARFLGDAKVVTLAEETLADINEKYKPRKRCKRVLDRNAYTDKQLHIIRGEMSSEGLNGRSYLAILEKARRRGDNEIAEFAERELHRCKIATTERNRERSRERSRKFRNRSEIVWKEAKSKEYSEYQKQIIRGEVPLEMVHTNMLIGICKKAMSYGDNELYERFYSLVIDRRNASHEYDKKRRKAGFHKIAGGHSLSQNDLTEADIEMLTGKKDVGSLRGVDFEHLLFLCEKTNDERLIGLARTLLQRHEHPELFYSFKTQDEAIDRIEQLMGVRIRRPETWFTPV